VFEMVGFISGFEDFLKILQKIVGCGFLTNFFKSLMRSILIKLS